MAVISLVQPGHFIDKHCNWSPGPGSSIARPTRTQIQTAASLPSHCSLSMACAPFYTHWPLANSVRNAPGLICQGCARSVPVTVSPHPLPMMDEYQNKGLTKWAIHKRLILKGLVCSGVAEALGTQSGKITPLPTPLFFVSVASKGLKHCASLLFATHTRGPISVASKGLTLHQNCSGLAGYREWRI